jgi:hypothetical protein
MHEGFLWRDHGEKGHENDEHKHEHKQDFFCAER